jgi:uncharacterized protein with HEPN domain
MSFRDDRAYLEHILEAIAAIEGYVAGVSFERFVADRMRVDAVVRELEIIGEASTKLTRGFLDEHPEIPFRDAMDMRNLLIHEYFGINKRVVWDTCHEDLPLLKKALGSLLKSED